MKPEKSPHFFTQTPLPELIHMLMKEANLSVRGLGREAQIDPSVIQRIRSGKQHDVKLTNFLCIIEACGYELNLMKKNTSPETISAESN